MKKIFLVRHAKYDGGGPNPSLSEYGREQAVALGKNIASQLNPGNVAIWTSSAARAKETADLIQPQLQLASMEVFPKLWSDNSHQYDFPWLQEMIDNFEGDNLIIVSHLEYVNYFPSRLGLRQNDAGYAQGIIVENGSATYVGP